MHPLLTGSGYSRAFLRQDVSGMAEEMSAKIGKNRENIKVYSKSRHTLKIQTTV
jgi:hypothetical protein